MIIFIFGASYFADDERWKIHSAPDSYLAPARLGSGVRIEDGALICAGVTIGHNAIIRRSIVGVRAQIGASVELSECIGLFSILSSAQQ